MSAITFLAVLFVLILVHEFGHYITAKWAKMRVDEFSIGFPPRIFSWKRGETEYTLGAIPIGGYVKIYGENGEDAATSDTPRAFTHRPRILQAIVLVAGVTMNILLAFILFAATYMMGVTTAVEEGSQSPSARLSVLSVLPNSPAAQAGLEPGDVIVSVASGSDASPALLPSEISNFISVREGSKLDIALLRGDRMETVTVTPVIISVPGEADRARAGFVMGLVEKISYSPGESISRAAEDTVRGLKSITVGIVTLIGDSITGEADLASVAGPIGIAGLVGDASKFGLTALLSFTALISLNLAVINMLPLPALDGGRLLMVGIEAIIRRPLNPRYVGWVNLVGFGMLIVLMIIVSVNDIARLIP